MSSMVRWPLVHPLKLAVISEGLVLTWHLISGMPD